MNSSGQHSHSQTTGKPPLAEQAAWLLFCAVSLQLAFLQPAVVLIPGEHTNLFSGLLCAISLAATLWAAGKERLARNPWQWAICLALAALLLASGWHSTLPGPNTWRALVLLASGLGGFWGGRLLLSEAGRQRAFLWLGVAILAVIVPVVLILALIKGQIYQVVNYQAYPVAFDSNLHPLTTKVLLLWFAPLALLWGDVRQKIAGAVLLGLSYLMFMLMPMRAAVFLPLAMGALAVLWRAIRVRYIFLILLACGVIFIYLLHHLPKEKMGKGAEYYRVENYCFSWHIASQHPFLGIGLVTPRNKFLQDYQIKFPYVTREKFALGLIWITVADNMFLTFMAGAGFPFLLLYSVSLFLLLARAAGNIGPAPPGAPIPPLALFLPLVAGVLSFFVYDILLHPQVCWFFHVLLGLASGERKEG